MGHEVCSSNGLLFAAALVMPSVEDDSVCAVCGDGNSSNDNLIVFCEGGCDVAVHQRCYGIANVPEDAWHCDACLHTAKRARASARHNMRRRYGRGLRSPSSRPSPTHKPRLRCVVCQGTGGALKPICPTVEDDHDVEQSSTDERGSNDGGEDGSRDWVHVICVLAFAQWLR